jgi:hypothetical protein
MERKHIARGRQLYSSNAKSTDQFFPIGNVMNSMLNEQQMEQLAQLQQLHQLQQNQQLQQEQSPPAFEQKVILNKDSLANYKFPPAESYHHQKHDGYIKMDPNNNYITNYLKSNSRVTKYYGNAQSPNANFQHTNNANAQTLSHSSYKHSQMSQYQQPYQQYSRQQFKYVKEPEEEDGCKVCDRPDKNLFCKTCSHNWKVSANIFYFIFAQPI